MWRLLFILLIGCSLSKRVATVQTNVVLDGTASTVTGGNGKGYFTKWEWKQIAGENADIMNPYSPATQTNVIGKGVFEWQLKVTTNTGQTDSAKCIMIVK